MNRVFRELAERIRGEVADLERVVNRILRVWPTVQTASIDQDAYLDSVALNLHGFYSGLERLFELTARHVDQSLPTGDTWRRDLLAQMSSRTEIRPAIISPNHAQTLDEYRRFRHLIRNIYATNLQPEKMAGLVSALSSLWAGLRAELLAFADFLEYLAQN